MARRSFAKKQTNMAERQAIDTDQPEWLDLKALQHYVCVSERTLRQWIHRSINPLPAVRVGTKILVRRATFDRWLEGHKVDAVDLSGAVDEIFLDVTNGR
jgi:excisionase family DNA binding protein